MKKLTATLNNTQSGYILPFALILLVGLLAASAAFFKRSVDSTQISGYSRDSAVSQNYAESVLNRFTGRYFAAPDTGTATNRLIPGSTSADSDRLTVRKLFTALNAAPTAALPAYMFYNTAANGALQVMANTTATGGITPTRILQAVADGEARNTAVAAVGANGFMVPTATTGMRIADLFNGTQKPLMFCGLTVADCAANATWSSETNPTDAAKAAVWIELVRDDTNKKMHVFVETVAQVGSSKTYLQRKVGSYSYEKNNQLGGISPMSESGNRY